MARISTDIEIGQMSLYQVRLNNYNKYLTQWIKTIPHEVNGWVIDPKTFDRIPESVLLNEKYYAIYLLKFT